jgi:hypothetical protein
VIVLVAVIALAGCASRAPRQPQQRYYVPIAEGLSSPTLAEGIRVAPRRLAAPDLMRACRDPRSVARLEAAMRSLDLQVGERFPLSGLRVVAVNFADVAMTAVPIVIEADDFSPPVLQLRSDNPDLNQGQLYSLNSGTFRLRIRTLCGTPGAEMTIRGRVEP